MPPPDSQHWTVEMALRVRRHVLLKLVGTSVFVWLFFIGYFQLLRHPIHAVTVMPLTALDRLIPFQPWTLGAYLSLWLYIGIAPGLQLTFRELILYGVWIAALCLTGLGLFYFWPTAVPPLLVDVSGFAGFAMLQGVDAAGNACPSMHVAVAMFSVIWVEHVLRQARVPAWLRAINVGWFLAITYSTLAIKQHVVLDVLAGALLGVAFALASLHWRPVARVRAPGAVGLNIMEPR
jgi:membrane-associated phospholipid phosphatase